MKTPPVPLRDLASVAVAAKQALADDSLPLMDAQIELQRRGVLREISSSLDLRLQTRTDADGAGPSSPRLVSGRAGEEETWSLSAMRVRAKNRGGPLKRELIDRELVHTVAEFRSQFTFHPEIAGFGRRFGENAPKGAQQLSDNWEPPV